MTVVTLDPWKLRMPDGMILSNTLRLFEIFFKNSGKVLRSIACLVHLLLLLNHNIALELKNSRR